MPGLFDRPPPRVPLVLTVGELTRRLKGAVEPAFQDVWVGGEVGNLRRQQSGHLYFGLKDDDASIDGVIWASTARRVKFDLRDGMDVVARGRIEIYAPRGRYQLVVQEIEPRGAGARALALQHLKERLAADGLLDPERKRPLPFLPGCIGVATSTSGAALQDFLRVVRQRFPGARVVVAGCRVQGEGAAATVISALRLLVDFGVDVAVVTRGGGSADDLWEFNDERLARFIAACPVPVVSAVGHEVDFTIADFVADRRAATPSQAAELVVPVHDELEQQLADGRQRLQRAGRRATAEARQRLDETAFDLAAAARAGLAAARAELASLAARLGAEHPRARLLRDRAQLVSLSHRLERPLRERLAEQRRALPPLERRLHAGAALRLSEARQQLAGLSPRAVAAMQRAAAGERHDLERLMRALHALSPLSVLDRGYALVKDEGGHVLSSAGALSPGQRVALRFARGEARATIDAVLEVNDGDEGDDGGDPAARPPPSSRPRRGGAA